MNRWRDWWAQAERDLRHAEHSQEAGDYEWSAFAAHQAAVKAVEAASRLDKHYLPARYPNSMPSGHPGELYTAREGETAIEEAREIIRLCRGRLPES